MESIMWPKRVKKAEGEILSGEIHDKNTFEQPEKVKRDVFEGMEIDKDTIRFEIPACSLVHLAVECE